MRPDTIVANGDKKTLIDLITRKFSGVFVDSTITNTLNTKRMSLLNGCPDMAGIVLKNATNITSYSLSGVDYGDVRHKLIDLYKTRTFSGARCIYCNQLKALFLRNTTLIPLSYATGSSANLYNFNANVRVYVPSALIETYKTATNWATLYASYPDMFRAVEDYTEDGTLTGDFDENLIRTPTNPLAEVTDKEVLAENGHYRYITTKPERVELTSSDSSSSTYAHVYFNDNGVDSSSSNVASSEISIPVGSTLKVTICDMSMTSWVGGSSGNNCTITLRRNGWGSEVLSFGYAALEDVFKETGHGRLERSYTNTGSSPIVIDGFRITTSMMANQTIAFSIMMSIDDTRII